MTNDICYSTASELARKIRTRELSPVEVVDAYLNRIEERNDKINAFVTVCDEEARKAAKEAEKTLENGSEIGPLHGVPVAIKDLNNVAGIRTTFGSKLFEDFVPEEDDYIVRRLKEAGAIILGKTNTPEFGRKPMTTNLLFGPTGNPWDHDKTVGGSSGGSAAALAEGLAPIAQGSDAAGSIRIPASACGVFGLMPDFGRVPLGPSADKFVNTLPYTFYGPMTRSVEDAALMLEVIGGSHPGDPFSLPERNESYENLIRQSLDGVKIAYSTDLNLDIPIDEEVKTVTDNAVQELKAAGADVERESPAFSHSWKELHDAIEVLLQIRYRGLYDNLKRDQDVDLLDNREDVTEEVVSRIEKSQELDGLDLRRAERKRTSAYDAVQDLLSEYDLLVTPTIAVPPFAKDTKPMEINGKEIDPLHGWILTWPFNLTGNPAASVPAGFTDNGLPVGLQIVGPRGGDDRVLAASAAYERVNPWQESYPP